MSHKEDGNLGRPVVVDLFSGAGGLSAGFVQAGFEVAYASDHWEDAAETYRRNHPGTMFSTQDVRTMTGDGIRAATGIEHLDALIGGPPCQGFSTLGKRDVDDPRNDLFREFIRLARELAPRVVMIENVSGLLIMEGGKIRENLVAALQELGYRVSWRQVTSADYGVPQLRRRAVFVGTSPELGDFVFPRPTHGPEADRPYLTVLDAIGDLPGLESGERKSSYGGHPETEYQRSRRNGCRRLHNHEAANHSASLVQAISFVPDGGNRQSIPEEHQPRSGFHNSYSRLASWKPAVAITSNLRKPSSARAVHPLQNRGLTVREGARLQSFDDDYVFECSRTSQYLQVGNAVPPLLSRAMAAQILRLLRGESLEPESRQLELALL